MMCGKRALATGIVGLGLGFSGQANAALDPPDLAVKFSDDSLAVVQIGGSNPVNLPVSGSLLLSTDSVRCAIAPIAGCRVEVEALNVDFGDLPGVLVSVGGEQVANVDLSRNNVALTTQVPALHSGTYFSGGQNENVVSTTRVYGEIQGDFIDDAYLSEWGVLPSNFTFDYATGGSDPYFTFEGQFPFTFTMNGDSLEGIVTIIASGETPFFNTMPLARAGDDIDAFCASEVILDASGTVDNEGDVVSYLWYVGDELVAEGETAEYIPTLGSTEVRLVVTDEKGSSSEDVVVVTASQGEPEFASFPEDVVASACGAIEIGEASAVSGCGEVSIENDAPSTFPVGTTVVTWTATSDGGVAERTQRVTVSVGNDASCCPASANVIHGTSNNDQLTGTEGVDCIFGYGGQDTISGLGGDDIIHAGDGDDVVDAGSGSDVVDGGSGQDVLRGGSGSDTLLGGDGDDQLFGQDGADQLFGGQGQDSTYGGLGNDTLVGSDGDDRIYGEEGDDSLDGSSGNNQCTGGSGFDTVIACSSLDTPESNGVPPYSGSSGYQVCECRPNKCSDCEALATSCQVSADCTAIIECVQDTTSCNLPHECAPLCETGRSAAAVTLARNLASCFGGCGQ